MLKFKKAQKLIAMFLPLCVLVCSLSCCFALFVPTSQGTVEYAEAVTSLEAPYYAGSYYEDLNESLTGTAFRAELADLITKTHHTKTTYAGLMNVWKYSDVDPNNSSKIIEFYTGYPVSIPSNIAPEPTASTYGLRMAGMHLTTMRKETLVLMPTIYVPRTPT